MIQISVVVPTYNRAHDIERNIPLLCSQSLDPNKYEVIISDNNSTDSTKEVVTKLSATYKNLHYVHAKKKGAAVARNKGAEIARGPIILFLDDDMIPNKDLLEQHLKQYEDTTVDGVLGYFDIELAKGDNKIFTQFLAKSEVQNEFPFKDKSVIDFRYFYTGNVSVKKSHFDHVGGFDEGYAQYGVEDIDLGYRLYLEEAKIVFCKKAYSIHNYSPALGTYVRKRYEAGQSLGYFLHKFPQIQHYFRFEPFAPIALPVLYFFWTIVFYATYLFSSRSLNAISFQYFHWKIRYAMYSGYRKSIFFKRTHTLAESIR